MTANELLKAIKKKCLDCCDHSRTEVKNCPITTCPLHTYRNIENVKSKSKKGE